MWFIADDNGDVYAHDIASEATANAMLHDILVTHPEYEELNIEVMNDKD